MNANNLNLAEVKDRVEFSGKYNILTNIKYRVEEATAIGE